MKNTFLPALLCAGLFAIASCQPKSEPTTAAAPAPTTDIPVVLDTFADLQVLHYDLPGWDQLSLRQKTFIYYLGEAALAGRDIIYDQYCQYNLTVRKTLEAIENSYTGDRTSADWKAFEVYAKRVWFSNGIHHHYNETKILPGIPSAYFAQLVSNSDAKALPLQAGETPAALIARLTPVLFDPTVLAKRTNKAEGADVVKASAINFYENLSAAQVDEFYETLRKAAGPKSPSFGLNSKLVAGPDGKPVERVWRAGQGNMYGAAIDQIVANLQKAMPFAENEQQKKAIGLLIEYYQTGDLKKFDAYSIAWVKDTTSTIDFINGFIEVYHDPKGYKGDYESVVQYNDPDATKKMAIVSQHAQYFEDNSTIPAACKKKNVTGISYRVINVAMEGGATAPATPIGINLPNADWIREDYGSKSISLNNIENAYGKAGGAAAVAEFANDPEEIAIAAQFAEACGKMHTALHEVIGHASGQLNPGVAAPNITLKQYASTLEEGRADLVALYFMADPKLVEWGLLPSQEAYKAEYDNYLRNGMLQQLRRIQPGDDIEEDHMRNRLLVSNWVYEKGKTEGVVVKEVRNGKTYLDIRDYAKLRTLFGQLLAEIQRIKSEGDYTAASKLVETYGVKVDPELVKEVKGRYAKLPTKAYSGFVQPRLVPVTDAQGNISDIRVEKETDFVKQMLRYGKDYGFLPAKN